VGSYPVTYTQLIAGHEPRMVFGSAQWHQSGVDEEFTGMLRFDGGMTASIHAVFALRIARGSRSSAVTAH
jgi:hypothetical protein